MIRFGQGLDHANALSIFSDNRNHPILGLLHLGEHWNPFCRFGVNQIGDKRQRCQHDHGQHRLHDQGDDHAADQQDRSADAHPLNHADHPVDIVRIAGQPAF